MANFDDKTDAQFVEALGIVGARMVSQRNASDMRNQFDQLRNRRNRSNLMDGAFEEDGSEVSLSNRTFLRMKSETFNVSIVNAKRDLVAPLSENMSDISMREMTMHTMFATDQMKEMKRTNSILMSMNDFMNNWVPNFVLQFRRFQMHPGLMSMMALSKVMKSVTSFMFSSFGKALVGWRRESDTDRIVKSNDQILEFMRTGQVDQRKGFFELLANKGIMGTIFAGIQENFGFGEGRGSVLKSTIQPVEIKQQTVDVNVVGMDSSLIRNMSGAVNDAQFDQEDQRMTADGNIAILNTSRSVGNLLSIVQESSERIEKQDQKDQKQQGKIYDILRRTYSLNKLTAAFNFVKSMVSGLGTVIVGLASSTIARMGIMSVINKISKGLTSLKSWFGLTKNTIMGVAGVFKNLIRAVPFLGAGLEYFTRKEELKTQNQQLEAAGYNTLTNTQMNIAAGSSAAGGLAGVLAGGAIGSFAGPIGTIIGGIIGGIGGSAIGDRLGINVASLLNVREDEPRQIGDSIFSSVKETFNSFTTSTEKKSDELIAAMNQQTEEFKKMGDNLLKFVTDIPVPAIIPSGDDEVIKIGGGQ